MKKKRVNSSAEVGVASVSTGQSEYKRFFDVSVEIKDYDCENIIIVIKKLMNAEKGIKAGAVEKMGGIIAPLDRLRTFLNNPAINRWICHLVENAVKKQGMEIEISDFKVHKKTENALHVNILISTNYPEIVAFVRRVAERSNDNRTSSLVLPVVEVICQTIPDDLKDELVEKIIESIGDEICKLMSDMLEHQIGLKIIFDKLLCTVCQNPISPPHQF